MLTDTEARDFIDRLGPDKADRLLTVLERVAELDDAERAAFFDTFWDVVEPLDAPRPHADPVKVAEGRAMVAAAGLPA